MEDKNCNFCIAPFTNMLICPDGTALICPKNRIFLGNTKKDLVEKIWESERLDVIRNDFAENMKNGDCHHCWQVEQDGGKSLRQYSTEIFFRDNPDQTIDKVVADWKSRRLKIKRFEFALSNTCNLACRHCWPISSTGLSTPKFRSALEVVIWPPRRIENDDEILGAHEAFSEKTFDKSMVYVSKSATQVSIVGGEPFLDKRIFQFLSSFPLAARSRVHLTITSNFARPDLIKRSLDYLENFKKIDVVSSIDGSPKITEYIRHGSEVAKIKESVALIHEHFKDSNGTDRLLLCNFAFQAMNLLDLPNAIRFIAGELQIQTICLLHVHERHLNINILPFELKQLAKDRLMNFIINEFEDLINPMHHQWYYDTIFTPVIKMCDQKDRNKQGWNEFMDFTESFDGASNKNIFLVLPELQNYWFKLED